MIDWYLEGVEFGNCNCDWCFPCELGSLPTRGHCRGFEVIRIDRGHFGDVALGGLNVALLYAWPGPMFEGNGELVAVIDERAGAGQRTALATILYGGETQEAKTHWWVFHAMSKTIHEPIFRAIDFEADVAAGTARVAIPGVLEATGRPIKSAASGAEHRVRIAIPKDIEMGIGSIGTANTSGSAPVELDLHDTFGQFNVLRHSGSGMVHRA